MPTSQQFGRYYRTVEWARLQQSAISVMTSDAWVASYLASLHHFEALEEHLEDVARRGGKV